MLTFIVGAAIGIVIGAVAVPVYPPLFRLAERIRARLNLDA